jgi:outer membrane protein assembly factor BamB
MKRWTRAGVLALAAFAVAAAASNGPIALDWQPGGHLYVLRQNGSVSILDLNTKRTVATIPPTFGTSPADIFSARLNNRDYVFVSGFWGRTGKVWQYTSDGKQYAKFDTPEQAASFDVDADRHLLYVASPVTNVVYSIDLIQKGSTWRRVAYLREAEAVGPVVFDRRRNRVMVGDSGRGVLYDVDVTTGAYLQVAANLGRPISLAMNAESTTLLVADATGGRVHVLRLLKGSFKASEVVTTSLRALSAVTAGPGDIVFVADGYGVYEMALGAKKLSRVSN